MATMQDVWPDNLVPVTIDPSTPIVILRAQAANLARKTQGVVTAKVDSRQLKSGQGELTFHHTLRLVAPLLGYDSPLLKASHGMNLYPVEILMMTDAMNGAMTRADNQQQLLEELRRAFSSDFCRKVISNYIAQSTASESDEDAA